MTPDALLGETDVEQFVTDTARLNEALAGAIVGQEPVIRDLLVAALAGGHALVEGLPGLGKTHLVKGLARCCGLPLARIQCTPDLMPADITGSEVLVQDGSGLGTRLEFRPGPLFAAMVLVDEINRSAPKTQAALLEAMQEGQVTYGGRRYPLPTPFFLVATQNPIELEGTYPLPEAQLDRFLVKIVVPYPAPDDLGAVVDVSLDQEPTDALPAILTPGRLEELQAQARQVVVAETVKGAAVQLLLAAQPGAGGAARHIRYGPSPRGLQALLRCARIGALLGGRVHVGYGDLARVALPCLRHRIILRMQSEMDGVTPGTVLEEIVEAWVAARAA